MAKKVFTDESLSTFVDEIKSYTDSAVSTKANSSHNHAATNITSGTLSSDRLPTVPITKGGTGATTAAAALTNLGITATATELNYVDGVTSNIQTQLNGKAASSHAHSAYVNQNAFSNVKVGSTTVSADSTTDTIEFAGSNVTITPDATNDKITFTVADASTTTKGVVQLNDSVESTSTTTAATANAVREAREAARNAANGVAGALSFISDITNAFTPTGSATQPVYYDGTNLKATTLGAAATYNVTTSVTSGSTALVTSGAVYSAIQSAITTVLNTAV